MHRIVIYPTGPLAEDAELLAAVGAAAGLDRETAAARLRAPGPVYLDGFDEAAARGLFELLAARGIDADLEPMAPPAGVAEWLRAEAPKWVRRGLLHPASLNLIFGNYGLEAPASPGLEAAAAAPRKAVGTATLLRAVLTLGAVLIGLGLVLFVAANWQRIPAPVKIGGALALTVAALQAGAWLRFGHRPYPRVGAALLLIALFGIGGVVILIAQIYHVQAESYLLPLIWGALCVPLALLLRFPPALYIASGLWLWSYWLHLGESGELPWIYPALLLGLLLPYALLVKDRRFLQAHLGILILAVVTTLPAGELWHCSVFVGALVLLKLLLREPRYDWLLVVGFFVWQLVFLTEYKDLPNVFYALPLAYFFYRAHESRSNSLMIANVLNAQFWLCVLLFQITARYDLGRVEGTGVLLWLLAAGLLWYGIGKRLQGSPEWRRLAGFLRYGGPMLAGLMVYVLSFRFYDDEASFYRSPLFLATTLGLAAVGVALALGPVLRESGGEGGRWGAPLVLALTATGLLGTFVAPPSLLIHALLFNLTLFAGALAMMLRGHGTQNLGWFNGGIALFVVLIGSRYFDTFVEYLPRSVFFVVGGLFLIGWAVLVDRQRKRRAGRRGGEADA